MKLLACSCLALALLGGAAAQSIDNGAVNGLMAVASRPGITPKIEIEAADDFVLNGLSTAYHATFTGLLTGGASTWSIGAVTVEIYRVFPNDSTSPPSGNVPTRANSPSDVAFASRSSVGGSLSYTATVINPTFTAANSVLNGIFKIPNQTTGGEGPVTGKEVVFDVTFNSPFILPADHYFFVPQVQVTGGEFLWLSSTRPIVTPGIAFAPDLQAWVRNDTLDPDWLRVGTDIVGGATPPTFNLAFTLDYRPNPANIIYLMHFGL
jgi:hypothetical protein